MKLRYLFLILAVPIIWGAWMRITLPEVVSASTSDDTNRPVAVTHADIPDAQVQRDAYEQQNHAFQQELAAKEAALKMRAKANENRDAQRMLLSSSHSGEWHALVSSNWAAFEDLRKRAAHNDTHTQHCTICDGTGLLRFCILCDHNDGKCVTCRGAGKLANGDLCPTCLGTGKCFLCGGNGKMSCPFCDDGTIYLNGPPPPAQLPYH